MEILWSGAHRILRGFSRVPRDSERGGFSKVGAGALQGFSEACSLGLGTPGILSRWMPGQQTKNRARSRGCVWNLTTPHPEWRIRISHFWFYGQEGGIPDILFCRLMFMWSLGALIVADMHDIPQLGLRGLEALVEFAFHGGKSGGLCICILSRHSGARSGLGFRAWVAFSLKAARQ